MYHNLMCSSWKRSFWDTFRATAKASGSSGGSGGRFPWRGLNTGPPSLQQPFPVGGLDPPGFKALSALLLAQQRSCGWQPRSGAKVELEQEVSSADLRGVDRWVLAGAVLYPPSWLRIAAVFVLKRIPGLLRVKSPRKRETRHFKVSTLLIEEFGSWLCFCSRNLKPSFKIFLWSWE